MTRILPHALWLGHAGDGRDYRQLFAEGIRAIVQLAAEEPPLQPPRDRIYCRFPLLDGPENGAELLALAIGTVRRLLGLGVPTLLCCSAGLSRSPAVAAAALAQLHSQPLAETLAEVARQHRVDVSPGLWAEIRHELGGR
jgi:protein-tyrosine phosphatase